MYLYYTRVNNSIPIAVSVISLFQLLQRLQGSFIEFSFCCVHLKWRQNQIGQSTKIITNAIANRSHQAPGRASRLAISAAIGRKGRSSQPHSPVGFISMK